MRKLLTVSILTLALNLTFAYKPDNDRAETGIKEDENLLVHRAGKIDLSVTSFGVLGSYAHRSYEPDAVQSSVPADYPAGSPLSYLFMGALWIGAEVEDSLSPYGLDTLVSVTDDCWWDQIYEFSPIDTFQESIYRRQRIADEEIIVVYCDTTSESVNPDPIDSRDHKPLGIKITQQSMAWKSSGYDEFIIINYYIENIFERTLMNTWVGIFCDHEVGQLQEAAIPQADDDLCGFIEHKGCPVIWMADNDGYTFGGTHLDQIVDDVMALMYAGSSAEEIQASFNWWISNTDSEYDWGPQWLSNYDIWGNFPGDGKGTPMGDKAKYRIMSNAEIDYDQAYSMLDWTEEGWSKNSSVNPNDIADGSDSRFLLSLGPFNLKANSVETLTVALVAGQAFHVDPGNYGTYLQGHTQDSLLIAAYYNNLNFNNLLTNIDSVLYYYNAGFDRIPIGPPSDFHVDSWGVDHIVLTWNSQKHLLHDGYRIYRGIESGVFDPIPLTQAGYDDTVFIDEDVSDNTVYYYVITSVNDFGINGDFSEEISINTGQPQTPAGLNVNADNGYIELEWEPNSDDDLRGYILYRKLSIDDDFSIVDTVSFNAYSDNGLTNGVKYFYKILAFDLYGNKSYFSDSLWAIPMAFDSGIMLINANSDDYGINRDYESMQRFYENILADYPHMIAYECPEDLTQLSPYSTIIWCKDAISGRIHFDSPVYNYQELFADYLDAGGQLILAGPRIIKSFGRQGGLLFLEHEFQYKYLNIKGIRYPEIKSIEFIGGYAVNEKFPDFYVDSTRAGEIVFPAENETGRLFGIGNFMPRDKSEIIYRFKPVEPDTSRYLDTPIGMVHETDTFRAAVLEFPLYYIEEKAAFEILHSLLNQYDEQVLIKDKLAPIPESIELLQNFPNPFNFRTEIRYILPTGANIKLEIFDILGRSIITLADEFQSAGMHSVTWDGHSADGTPSTSGIYFYRLTAGNEVTAKRMVYLK